MRIEDKSQWSLDNIPVWNVYRRYSDFLDFYWKLKQSFPLIDLELPPKRWLGNNFDPVFIGKRLFRLQEFIDDIFSDEELTSSIEVRNFFSIDNPPNKQVAMEFDRV